MDLSAILLVAGGLAVLVVGGEIVVRSASGLAQGFRISPVVIGLTVVAFGTSAPELAVSLGATLGGTPDVAVGNIVGSNIYNVLLILGLSAVVAPLIVRQQLVRFDVPIVIGVSALLWIMALDGGVSTLEGALLFAGLVAYTVVAARKGRHEAPAIVEEYEAGIPDAHAPRSWRRDVVLFLAGLAALVLGAQALVSGATSVARGLGIPELVIGLTVVAVGTSLPELVTSVVAAIRGQRDIAVGNVVGSNLFNILGVLGLSAIVAPGGAIEVPEAARTFDIPVMTAVAVACLPLFFTGMLIRRWEGALFLAYALAYTAYLVLDATQHELRDELAAAMVFFVIPLTVVTIAVVLLAEVRRRRSTVPVTPDG
jgi:cation:H+ antiporter